MKCDEILMKRDTLTKLQHLKNFYKITEHGTINKTQKK